MPWQRLAAIPGSADYAACRGRGPILIYGSGHWRPGLRGKMAPYLVQGRHTVAAPDPAMRSTPRNSLPAFGYYIQDLHAAVAYGLIVLTPAGDETSAITGCGDQLYAGPFRAARTCPASQVAIPFRAGAGLHWRKLAARREPRLHAICVDERTDHDQP